MVHELGECHQKLGIKYIEHNEIRKYYIWRNKLYMIKKYPFLKKRYIKSLFRDLIKVLFFEKNTFKKCKFILRGIEDFKNKKIGRKIDE